ncbi:MAG: SLC13 family permease [Cetobacterium sp.]|uniref:GntP family permease n=1 Tax=unclassified Cetobacterium TaxID=2630983 RepID=UPI00163CB868|nr:SLC13 family permease [Cetobacterium sp. 2A]MBC2856927.1 GntP family permease [Cetobacterium sp. 2A]
MTAFGAILGLLIAIVLIIRKANPAYSLILGAVVGGVAGGLPLTETVKLMIDGVKDISPAIVRIITAGILAGVLIKTGAASKIAETIIEKLGEKRALIALAISTLILTSIGVFIDVAVITVAPIALAVGKRAGLSKMSILLAMVGGGKSGNIISPNPNTISAAENFGAPLSSVMWANIIPAFVGLVVTVIVANFLIEKGEKIVEAAEELKEENEPSLIGSIIGPIVTIVLLSLRPIAGINIDPLIALPVGGLAGIIVMGKFKKLRECMEYGLSKMSGVAILLIGTGTVSGIIKNSSLKDVILDLLKSASVSEQLIAPISGALMSAATASTTAGATIASATFSGAILMAGISAISGAAMTNAGATVLDHLPHGSFFHATGGATNVSLGERLRLIPYETIVGFSLATVSTLVSIFLNK